MTHEEIRARGLIYEARYNALHPGRREAITARWRKAHSDLVKERAKGYAAKYAATHPEQVRARAKRFAAAHPDRVKARNARYHAANAKRLNMERALRLKVNPEKTRERSRATHLRFVAAHPERYKAMQTKYRKSHVMTTRLGHLKRAYGLTPDAFIALLEGQGYRCAICGKALVNDKTTSVDHNHKTGRVRGLLCRHCNVGIGLLGDSSARVTAAAEYLRKDDGVATDSAEVGER